MACLFRTAFLFSLIIFSIPVSAQTRHQVVIISENDGYISVNNDGYYTNGLKVSYQWRRTPANEKRREKVNTFQVGQLIYTAQFAGEARLDRPITGYLYGDFHQSLFNKKQDLLKWGVGFGMIGPPALGKEMQERVHQVMQIYKPKNWDKQLRADWGLIADASWSPQLKKDRNAALLDVKPLLSVTAGNFFTHATLGSAFLLGRSNLNNATAFWDNHKGSTRANREYFIYVFPAVSFKAYDATVQGGMFKEGQEAIEGRLNPVFFHTRMGAMYAGNKLSFGAAAIYESKQSFTQASSQWYGSLQVGFMW
ncbi:lipid A-modifier LpxR family protein [Niabella aurantiaca]|uniref:lipid A-modifier LpxR family protein n=1 Tax=Niabella aurantiaca TaxID=379900 RepID=UPI000367DB12|nr:lipid A-modifier LpxR family protein [Niabella aurantiaca]